MKLLIGFALFLILIGFGSMIFIVVYVYKKSTKKKTQAFLVQEKDEMESKLLQQIPHLEKWNPKELAMVSNKMKYQFSKGLSRKFNGLIHSGDNKALVAFRMIDRGMKRDAQIMAMGKSFKLYIRAEDSSIRFFLNEKFIGSIQGEDKILDASGRPWGRLILSEKEQEEYSIILKDKRTAKLIKNTERRRILFNPFYDFYYQDNPILQKDISYENEVVYHDTIMTVMGELNEKEYEILLGILVFDLVYNGIWFAQ